MRRTKISWRRLFVLALIASAIIGVLNISAKNASAAGEYDWVKDLLISKVPAYNPDTQTIVVLNYNRVLTEDGVRQGLDLASVNHTTMAYQILIDGEAVPVNTPYYDLDQAAGTVKNKSTYSEYPDHMEATNGAGKATVFLVDKDTEIAVKPVIFSNGYGYFYRRGDGILYRPHTENDYAGNPQTADGDIVTADITFEIYKTRNIDLEIWMVSSELRQVVNPGFVGVRSYVQLKVELRDKDGNVFLMPKEYVYNISEDDWTFMMEEDGYIDAQITPAGDPEHSEAYGEIEFNFPQGYDYRITVLDYGEEELGQYVHFFDYDFPHDEEGFALAADDTGRSDTFIELSFLPRDKKLTIRNIDESDGDEIKTYYYKISQTLTGSDEIWLGNGQYEASLFPDRIAPMMNYVYRLYDSNTDEEIEPDIKHETDANGILTLKTNQYAVFDVYTYPEDIAEYASDWFTIQDYLEYTDGIDTPRPFYSEIVDPDQYSKIYNGESVFTGTVATAYAGESITYLIKGSSSPIDNPPTVDGLALAIGGLTAFGIMSFALVRKHSCR